MRTYTIAGNPVIVQKNSLSYNDRLNERSTVSFVVIEPTFEIDIGMEVFIEDDGNIIFGGTIENSKSYGDKEKYVSVSCVDFSQLIDTRIIADSFENTLAGDIVRSFISNKFFEEGIIAGNIQDGPVISKAVFNYDNGNVALNYLTDTTGHSWYIDKDKKLHFFERSAYTAPTLLADNSSNYSGLQVSKSRGEYRNRQYIRAGQDMTQEIIKEKPTPKPDGVSKTFVTRLPIAKKPRIYIEDVEVIQDDIGVNGLDKNKKYYFTFNSNTITQDDSEAVLSTEKLEISYFGLYPLLVVAENPEEIENRKTLEGGSGIYENIIQEQNIDTRDAAFQLANGKLDKYGIIPKIVTWNTYERGLKAGQLIPIQNTKHNLNDSFLIESVTARDDNGLTLYSVKALDGSSLGGWEKLFKSLIEGNKKLVIRENEVLVLLNSTFESQSWKEDIQIAVNVCPVPSENLYPSEILYPC